MVGVGGGVPSQNFDIRLGDVVVSRPTLSHGGVVQYDFGKTTESGFLRTGCLNAPPTLLLNAIAKLEADRGQAEARFMKCFSKLNAWQEFSQEGVGPDVLFEPSYNHIDGETCTNCDLKRVIKRKPRGRDFLVLYGTIASGNQVMRDATERDKVSSELGGVLCFEMEAAGLMNTFPCLVIRGICDYADSHKNKRWQTYAGGAAAVYAKQVLSVIPSADVSRLGLVNHDFAEENGPRTPRGAIQFRGESFDRNRDLWREQTRKAKETELLRRLNVSPYRAQKERNPDRIQGTCEWFTAHRLFRDWKDSSTSRILWVSADPGCGKSVLAKYLVDDVLVANKSRTICYFFFKGDFDDQRIVVSALSCILHQLFMQKRILLSEAILEQIEVSGENFTSSFDELWNTLISIAEDENNGEIIVVLDAIDECEECGRSQLIKALCKLYGKKRNFNLKFLLSSRPYGDIRRGFQPLEIPELPIIRLSGGGEVETKKISQEIGILIEVRVSEIGAKLKLKHDEQELLLQKLIHVPNRTYLWVHLTLDLIENNINIDKAGIVDAISHLPHTVDEAYERILSRSRDTDQAKKLLQIVVAAMRPLTLKEMSLALALTENHHSYSDLDLKSEQRFREDVRDLCGLFVTVIDSRIYLLHQTAKEFLVRNNQVDPIGSVREDFKWKYSLQPQESHRILTNICIWHLNFTEFETNPLREDVIHECIDSHIFLDYSAKNWVTHFHESHIKDGTVIQSLLRLCDTTSSRFLTWFRIYWTSTHTDFPKGFTTLMVASYFGFRIVVKILLESNDIDLNLKDGTYRRSALSWAARNGYAPVVELLIKGTSSYLKSIVKLAFRKGAQVESVDRYRRTPLLYAAWNGHVAVVKVLLNAGARIYVTDEIDGTPLSYATFGGHKAVVQLLYKNGTQVRSDERISENELDWDR
jgi:nucleoside phosphorylase